MPVFGGGIWKVRGADLSRFSSKNFFVKFVSTFLILVRLLVSGPFWLA